MPIKRSKGLPARKLKPAMWTAGIRVMVYKPRDVVTSGRKRGMPPQMKKEMKIRNAIEPIIGHMKSDGKLDRNHLTGMFGD